MRNTHFILFVSALTLFSLVMGCKSKKVAPVSERIAKIWTASKVEANGTTIYTKGGTTNVFDYKNFKLDLSSPPTVRWTELDGSLVFVGQYSLPDDKTLQLTNLNPVPSDGASITFTINSIDDNNLNLTRKTSSLKTGGTINTYSLTNP